MDPPVLNAPGRRPAPLAPAHTVFFLAVFSLLASFSAAQEPQDLPVGPDSKSPGIREFVPGIRIDWKAKEVLVDARVILRKGPLELVACSPKTREHESILLVPARARHIYQAMGLIGLEPGKPLQFDETAQKWIPPSGSRLEILVRFEKDGSERTVAIVEWLEVVETRQPPTDVEWVFAGSVTLDDGRFAADMEGTIVCVVDFEAALIAIRGLHTADNEMLWLRARTDAIPPVGTLVTILIRAAPDPKDAGQPRGVEAQSPPGDNRPADGGHPTENPQ